MVSLANDASATVELNHSVGNPLEKVFGHGSKMVEGFQMEISLSQSFLYSKFLFSPLHIGCDVDKLYLNPTEWIDTISTYSEYQLVLRISRLDTITGCQAVTRRMILVNDRELALN